MSAPVPLTHFGIVMERGAEPEIALKQLALGEQVIEEYKSLRLLLRALPMELLHAHGPPNACRMTALNRRGPITATGLLITCQRPGTASGMIFLTLEDETGVANVMIWKKVYEIYRKAVNLLTAHAYASAAGSLGRADRMVLK